MTQDISKTAARFVAKAMGSCHPRDREAMLAAMIAHATGAARAISGDLQTAEFLYRLADFTATVRHEAAR